MPLYPVYPVYSAFGVDKRRREVCGSLHSVKAGIRKGVFINVGIAATGPGQELR